MQISDQGKLRDKEVHYTVIKWTILQKGITSFMCVHKRRSKIHEVKLIECKKKQMNSLLSLHTSIHLIMNYKFQQAENHQGQRGTQQPDTTTGFNCNL